MKLISLNVGLPRIVESNGEPVTTGIFKEPKQGPVMLRTLNLDGDRQADLRVHGGVSKAVYGYPVEHYEFWRRELPDMELPFGMFGENFTTEGLREDTLNVGDRFRIGEAELMVTEPRLPCYKLGIKFGRSDILRRFLQSRRTGFYFAVIEEGEVGVGDELDLLEKSRHGVRVSDITRLYVSGTDDTELLRRASAVEELPESWRAYFQELLETLE